MVSTNPLQQYFRRPGIYLKLPSQGLGYPEGAIDLPENGELPVFPMTAIDEITTRTPDSLYNGTAVCELIKSCVPSIKDPWSIPVTDLDPLLVAIRIATNGALMEIDTSCPSCNESSKYDINLTAVLNNFSAGDYNAILAIDSLKFKFRPLLFKEINETNLVQVEIQKMVGSLESMENDTERMVKTKELLEKINQVAVEIISKTIEFIQTPDSTVFEKEYIVEFLKNCDKQTFEKIKEVNLKLREGSENKPLQIKCMHCEFDYEKAFTINPTTFFG
jgi:hypothetical protein